jgi:hypothetical protein
VLAIAELLDNLTDKIPKDKVHRVEKVKEAPNLKILIAYRSHLFLIVRQKSLKHKIKT